MLDLMLSITLAAAVVLSFYYFVKYRREYNSLRRIRLDILQTSRDMYHTMAIGIYQRFRQPAEGEAKEDNPLDFENFVARIMVNCFGGQAYVTGGTGDFGVDIEHSREAGLYLGQVKCYAPGHMLSYEPIAIIHSQIVKQQAKGGYVVTTSDFTTGAKKYVDGLNITLINGSQLVELWLQGLAKQAKPYNFQKAKPESA